MKIVLLILVFVYVIAFFWFIWKSAAQWRWYHMVLTSLIFLLTLPLLPLTAGVLKSRAEWSKQAQDLEERLRRGIEEKQAWETGVSGDPQKDPGVLELQGKLRTINAEVGRVFRDLEVRDRQGLTITLGRAAPQAAPGLDGMPVEPEEDAAGDANQTPLAAEGSIVYGFAEDVIEQGGPTVPVFYLGEYKVLQSTPDSVTIEPSAPLEPFQANAASQRNGWALYEMMPLDSHKAFMAEGSAEDDDQIFGRADEELIRELFGNSVPQSTIDDYLRDGTRARPDDPIETLWVKIRFTKKVEIPVDSEDARSASDGGFFDALGQAVDSRLQRAEGNTVTFEPGEQLVVKKEWATEKIQQGEAELIDQYFVRPLNSYRYVMRAIRENIIDLNTQAANLRRQKDVINVALQLTNDMITKGQQRQLNLEKDEAQIARELKALKAYAEELQSELSDARQRQLEIRKANLEDEERLKKFQKKIESDIKTLEAQVGL